MVRFRNFEPKESYYAVLDTLKRAVESSAVTPVRPVTPNNGGGVGGGAIAWKKASWLVLDVPNGINQNGQRLNLWGPNGPGNEDSTCTCTCTIARTTMATHMLQCHLFRTNA
jgi:hypothetical protein